MQGLRIFGLLLIVLFGCRPQSDGSAAKNATPDSPRPTTSRALLAYTGASDLHNCKPGFSGYPGCHDPHVRWVPKPGSPLRKLGDTLYSRVVRQFALPDGGEVFLIESAPAYFDCEACAPALGLAIMATGSDDFRVIPSLGTFGAQGTLPTDIGLRNTVSGRSFLRLGWSSVNQGIASSGISIVPLSQTAHSMELLLEESNEGACGTTVACYHFQYRFADSSQNWPDTLRLISSGTRPDSNGSSLPVSDSLVVLPR